MSFPLVSFKVNPILMENGIKTRQWHYQLMRPKGIGTSAGVSAATLFYKFRPGALTVHAKQEVIFFSMTEQKQTIKTTKQVLKFMFSKFVWG